MKQRNTKVTFQKGTSRINKQFNHNRQEAIAKAADKALGNTKKEK